MLDIGEIQREVAAWSDRNFPHNTPMEPLEGIIEELGELAHARLKGRQKIRHTAAECEAMERDAIGDMGVYLCDFAARSTIRLDLLPIGFTGDDFTTAFGQQSAFLDLAAAVGDLAREVRGSGYLWTSLQVSNILAGLVKYAKTREWDFMEILKETWGAVKERDWTKRGGADDVARLCETGSVDAVAPEAATG